MHKHLILYHQSSTVVEGWLFGLFCIQRTCALYFCTTSSSSWKNMLCEAVQFPSILKCNLLRVTVGKNTTNCKWCMWKNKDRIINSDAVMHTCVCLHVMAESLLPTCFKSNSVHHTKRKRVRLGVTHSTVKKWRTHLDCSTGHQLPVIEFSRGWRIQWDLHI